MKLWSDNTLQSVVLIIKMSLEVWFVDITCPIYKDTQSQNLDQILFFLRKVLKVHCEMVDRLTSILFFFIILNCGLDLSCIITALHVSINFNIDLIYIHCESADSSFLRKSMTKKDNEMGGLLLEEFIIKREKFHYSYQKTGRTSWAFKSLVTVMRSVMWS